MSDSIVIEESNGEVIIIEPTVVINQGSNSTWGEIGGDIGDQSDLIAAFAKKMDVEPTVLPAGTSTDTIVNNGVYSVDSNIVKVSVVDEIVNQIITADDKTIIYRQSYDGGTTWETERYIAFSDELDLKVDKVIGKSLSTNDYTDTEKTKLAGIEEGAQVNPKSISAGVVSSPTYTDNGDGTINLSAIQVSLFLNSDFIGLPKVFEISGETYSLANNATNYLVADYNAGAPIIRVTQNVTEINESTIIPILTIYRNGIYLHTLDWDSLGLGLSNKIHQSIVKTQRYRRESGLAISESGTRNVNITSGVVWVGANAVDLSAIASATDNIFFWYHVGGVWTQSVVTQYNNTQYDNGTNLATLTSNRYAVNWVFRGVENPKHLYIVLGNGDFTQSSALSSTVPSIPPAISSHAVLVGRILVVKSSNTAYAVQSAFDTTFVTAPISIHNDLSGLNDGDYQHLTVAEKNTIKPLTEQATPVSETKAILTIQSALRISAKPLGVLGNYITVRAVSSGVAGMSISDLTGAGTQANPYLIEIKLGTTVANNTMTLIAAAIGLKPDVAAIVNTIVITGATQMTAFAVVELAGGVDGSVGYLGETRFDTNAIEWRMCYTTAGCYYWAVADSNVYPALDTEYICHYCVRLGKPVLKMAKEAVTAPTGGIMTAAHGIIGFSRLYEQANIFVLNSAGNNIGNYWISTTDRFAGWVNSTNCQTDTPNAAALNSKPAYFKFKYIKV